MIDHINDLDVLSLTDTCKPRPLPHLTLVFFYFIFKMELVLICGLTFHHG